MKNNVIKLNENTLRLIVAESVKKVLNEVTDTEPLQDFDEEVKLWISENRNIHHDDPHIIWLIKEVANYFYDLGEKHFYD